MILGQPENAQERAAEERAAEQRSDARARRDAAIRREVAEDLASVLLASLDFARVWTDVV